MSIVYRRGTEELPARAEEIHHAQDRLTENFEVSSRTIQRDIETLNFAGIPITSLQGKDGGYGIINGFKLEKQIASTEDHQFIITALTGMNSAYNNKKLEGTLEKLRSIFKRDKTSRAAETIGVIYKWYAWYMLGYCCNKKDYRMFKVVQMRNLRTKKSLFQLSMIALIICYLAKKSRITGNTWM
ncbi:HTH domain protein [compost metagenome]